MAQVHTESFQIRANEVDTAWKLRIPSLIHIMQEAAWNNSEALGASVKDLQKKGISWVMTHMALEINHLPRHRDIVFVETWPSGSRRSFVYRDYRIYNQHKELIGQASSSWLVLDLKSRRMSRVPLDMESIIQVPEGCTPLPRVEGKLPDAQAETSKKQFPVRWHDLDPNNHVSNSYYFQWAIESLPDDFIQQNHIKAIKLLIRAESALGDEISLTYGSVNSASFVHEIRRVQDGKLLAQAQTWWEGN